MVILNTTLLMPSKTIMAENISKFRQNRRKIGTSLGRYTSETMTTMIWNKISIIVSNSNLSYRAKSQKFNTFRFQNEFSLAYDNAGNYRKATYKVTIKGASKRNHYFELGRHQTFSIIRFL
jgi:hypothetical protein